MLSEGEVQKRRIGAVWRFGHPSASASVRPTVDACVVRCVVRLIVGGGRVRAAYVASVRAGVRMSQPAILV